MMYSLKRMCKGCVFVLLLFSMGLANEYPEYEGPSSISISEDQPRGALVFNFTVKDSDGDPLTVTINHDKKFQLTEVSSNLYTITLKDNLDRETTSRYTLQITISDGTGTTTKDVRIRLKDVNDYTPVIKNLPLKAKIKENQPVGTFVIKIVTDDEDMGYNAATEIFLEEDAGPFYLGNPSTGQPLAHSYDEANVLLGRPLDFELQSLYLVKVTVTDVAGCNGTKCQKPLSTTQTLIVNVEDEQDTPPYFTGLPYMANTVENMPVGSAILQVHALDGDSSSARDIEYFFVSEGGEFESEQGFFAIDSNSGLITNIQVIDTDSADVRTHGSGYSLTVVAREELESDSEESINTALSQTTTSVSITIFDLNDQRPTFSASQMLGSVGEELPVGSLVNLESPVRVSDPDQGVNGTFSLRVLDLDGNESQWFSVSPTRAINEAVLSLATKKSIDFETTPEISIKVEAKEQNMNQRSYINITIKVTDNNDNHPVFSQSSYYGTVSENSLSGATVNMSSVLRATDSDSTGYGAVTYSISGGSERFTIDSKSAVVSVKCDNCLDRESQTEFHLNILATDGGGLTDSTQLVVYITDINDSPPKFSTPVYEAVLNESATRFNSPVVIEASDEDEGLNGEIDLTILNYTNHFTILPNGTVSITTPVDAEAVPSTLNIVILATDKGLPAQTSTAILRLQIKDLNDNKPKFTQTPSLINVPENTDIGYVIHTVTAKDDDLSPPNNQIAYSLSDNFGHFSIDPVKGEVKVTKLLDREGVTDEFTLIVLASDKGQPSKVSQQTIVVKITDVNDERPRFEEDVFRFEVNEEAPTGHKVGTVQAGDSDLNSLLTYAITESKAYNPGGDLVQLENALVEIESNTGVIRVSSTLDRESVSRIELQVSAEDVNGLTQQVSTAKVEILVADVNDNRPMIEPVGILQVMENSSDNGVLVRLVVNDRDQESQMKFSLSNNPEGAFSINNLGEIRLTQVVDRETTGEWMNITVVVQDGVNNALNSSLDIPVRVRDVNDRAPQFTRFESRISIEETRAVGENLTKVVATDADHDPLNRQIEYRIKSGGEGKFSMHSTQGLLKVAGDLDVDAYEVKTKVMSLVVEACDFGVPKLCTSRTMIINIGDVNDNIPTFTRNVYKTTISESALQEDKVLIEGIAPVKAVDIDAAPNGGSVVYSCCEPTNDTLGLFNINGDGEIIVAPNQNLTGHVGTYSLTVVAKDGGSPPRSGSAKVVVNVEDVNDHRPVLLVVGGGSTTIHRPENSERGYAIISIQATDADVGDNSYVDLSFVREESEGEDYKYFLIERSNTQRNRFIIRQNIIFDRESKSKQYKFKIVGKDRGLPQETSAPMEITVIVDDINDNQPRFSADNQRREVSVREEEVGVFVGQFNLAVDPDGRQLFCYSIIGARSSEASSLPFPEHSIRSLFTINSKTAEIKVASDRKLDRESQDTYILVIQADDRDENIYSNCGAAQNIPWTNRRTGDSEMEVVITVADIDDNPPVFTQQGFTLAAIRGVAPPTILTNLRKYVTDLDEGQNFEFSRGRQFQYSPSRLSRSIEVSEPLKVYANGEVTSEVLFADEMKGSLEFTVNATSKPSGLSAQTWIRVLIIDPVNVFSMTVAKELTDVESDTDELKTIFRKHARFEVSVIRMKANTAKSYHTDIQLFVVPNNTENFLTSQDIQLSVQNNPKLADALYKYGYTGMEHPVTSSSTDDDKPQSSNRVIIIAVVVAVVLLVVMATVLILCYVMRNRYQRKLKAAHAMAFDTHTLGFEIDQADVPPSLNNIPSSIKNSTPVSPLDDKMSVTSLLYPHHTHEMLHDPYYLTISASPGWNKDSPLNNFDWGNANGAFDRHKFYRQSRESHRSSNSPDDNAIDPLNGTETHSCSSAGSNDWRLDLRGNNLDCSPPPPITDDVIQTAFNEHNNQLNCDSKFVDSQSDHSNSTNKEDGHFNRLIMSDSVYGKIYETRRMPNGLETTEV